jgi:hypothetical protein
MARAIVISHRAGGKQFPSAVAVPHGDQTPGPVYLTGHGCRQVTKHGKNANHSREGLFSEFFGKYRLSVLRGG